MKILEKEFRSQGFNFKQVRRIADKAIYKKTAVNGKAASLEVIRIKSHNGYEIAGVKIAPAETYPSSSQWGLYGWTYSDMSQAMKKFASLSINEEAKGTPEPLSVAVRTRTRR